MTADLRSLIAGRLPETVVPACRLEGFGGEAFGREAIAAAFARFAAPGDAWLAASGATAAALTGFTPDAPVLFADLHDGMIVRLWRLGPAVAAVDPVPVVRVAADDDLHQSRRAVFFDPVDHPGLAATGVRAVGAAAELATADRFGLPEPPLRARAFVRRAFSDGTTHVGLFGLSVLANGARRQPLAFNMLALCAPGAPPRLIVDHAGLAAAQARMWAPHL